MDMRGFRPRSVGSSGESTIVTKKTSSLLFAAALATASPSFAQLRIVTMNGANSSVPGPRAGMENILAGIGTAISDDPLIAGNSGISKPIDILCLQESQSAASTAVAYAALLNSHYGTTHYQYGLLDGGSTGSGTQSVVYNADAVTLVSEAAIGTAS